ncbi:hypothetical protein DFH07DRAFT_49145 [Mycena maculata]|uniref:C2H2-type domain-containing protein n=1 Tax=Mycena maculata TaxID=230809 RepID=A0AAD7IFJ9_9AGAR|nr:hypothetical protein DFH07DRAFT_49145 [Mycena maculata]
MTRKPTRHQINIIRRILFPLPQTSTYSVSYAGTGPPLSFNGSEGSAPSSPRLSPSPEYDPSPPPPSLEPFLSHAPLDEARHRKSGSPKLPPKMHPCHICFKQFPRPSGLKTHMNSHTNTRPYTCGFHNCSKTFSVRSNAKRHYRTHGGTAPPPGAAPAFSVNFEEPNIAPSQPQPPPAALSRAPYRVRFLEPNRLARTRTGGPNPAQSDIELREGQGQGNDHDHEYKQTDYDFADVQPTTTTATYYQNSWNAYAPGALSCACAHQSPHLLSMHSRLGQSN